MRRNDDEIMEAALDVFENWARKQKRVTTRTIMDKWGCDYDTAAFWYDHLKDMGIIGFGGYVNGEN